MNSDMKAHVIDLLEGCPYRIQKIALLHYELDHPAHATKEEMIEAMAFGHGEGGGYHADGRISDKTFYIALNYQGRAEKANTDLKEEIVEQLIELEREQRRLEYYASLLESRQAEVVRLLYFKGYPAEVVAEKIGVVPRTIRRIKKEAIDRLAEMYSFTDTFAE